MAKKYRVVLEKDFALKVLFKAKDGDEAMAKAAARSSDLDQPLAFWTLDGTCPIPVLSELPLKVVGIQKIKGSLESNGHSTFEVVYLKRAFFETYVYGEGLSSLNGALLKEEKSAFIPYVHGYRDTKQWKLASFKEVPEFPKGIVPLLLENEDQF
jgi:hypothetical protein